MAKRKRNILTDAAISKATDGEYSDGGGLALRVAKSGTHKSWVLRVHADGKRVARGLGSYPEISITAARQSAAVGRSEIKTGREPVQSADLNPVAVDGGNGPTFRQVSADVIDLRRPTWRSERHAKQWTESLTNHVFPAIGDKPVSEITSADVLAVLTPIWTALPETSTRVKQRMGVIFDYAIAAGLRGDNPATAVGRALPRRARLQAHHPALHHSEVTSCVGWVRDSNSDDATRLAFEFLVLTAARAGEVRGATWAEIDLPNALWTIPAARMKAGKAFRIPLSDAALDVLWYAAGLIRGDGRNLVFPNKRTGNQLTNMAFAMMLRRLEIAAVPHGFRASFRNWSIEIAHCDWAVGETALAHRLGGLEVQAYARTDLLEQRRELMQQWADFVVN